MIGEYLLRVKLSVADVERLLEFLENQEIEFEWVERRIKPTPEVIDRVLGVMDD
jgi:hypothetical protein